MLKKYLEDPNLLKYIWDGRSDYSELRHGHGITLKGLVDLQLVYIYATGNASSPSRAVRLTGMTDAAETLSAIAKVKLSQIRSCTSRPHNLASDNRPGRSKTGSSAQWLRNLAVTPLADLSAHLCILRYRSSKSIAREVRSTPYGSSSTNSRRVTSVRGA